VVSATNVAFPRAATGILGLDEVLGGGVAHNRMHLVEGSPGTGKTTLALQFLLAGAERNETGLYISLAESELELQDGARSYGWEIADKFTVFELVPPEAILDPEQHQSLLYSSDLELGEATQRLFEIIERLKPTRVVVDTLSEIRLLAQSPLRYRRQILALKHYFARNEITAILLDDMTGEHNDGAVHSIAHSVINLEQLSPLYGDERRRMRIAKCRGQSFRGGYHDYIIDQNGVRIFPRLVAAEQDKGYAGRPLRSGVKGLDDLLGGGIPSGSSTLVLGPAGAGKTLLCFEYIAAAVKRGERAALFEFDEELGLLFARAQGMGIDLAALRDDGKLHVEQIDAAEVSPGEFTDRVRTAVEKEAIRTVIVDSLNGYSAAMPEEQFLTLHLHEIIQYLNRCGTSTFVTLAQSGTIGEMRSPVDLTYLADNVLMLRYFEAFGRVRRAISVVKKRGGAHEDTIREFAITSKGLEVGLPLNQFQGVLRGVPTFFGGGGELMGADVASDTRRE
jgi:circadian clock protein KaiC